MMATQPSNVGQHKNTNTNTINKSKSNVKVGIIGQGSKSKTTFRDLINKK